MIRLADIEDLSKLLEIERNSFDEKSYPLSKDSFKRFIKLKHLFVYEIESNIAGYILVIVYKKSIRIYSLAVSEEFRGKGISKELINFIIDKYKTYQIVLEVKIDNTIAINLYEKLGFKKVNILKDYYVNEDGVKMLKR